MKNERVEEKEKTVSVNKKYFICALELIDNKWIDVFSFSESFSNANIFSENDILEIFKMHVFHSIFKDKGRF